MSSVVLAYPTLAQQDFDWIQAIRRTHDRLFDAVEPHFTIVFPTEKLSAPNLVGHTESKVCGQPKILFALTKALVIEDDSQNLFHAFLVPSIGRPEITALHDLMYTGVLASELRVELPFIPHITIATSKRQDIVQQLVEEFDDRDIEIKGVIESLTVSSYDGIRVKDIKRVPLE
jgi:2'-5' RNA ligase